MYNIWTQRNSALRGMVQLPYIQHQKTADYAAGTQRHSALREMVQLPYIQHQKISDYIAGKI